VSRRGWASVREDDERWSLVTVYDDGWCSAPVAVPTAADTRARMRALVGGTALVVGLFTAAVGVGFLLPDVPWLPWVLLAGSLVALVVVGARAARRRARSRPPVFGSAAEHAAAEPGATRVELGSVRSLAVQRHGHEDVVTIVLRKGKPLVYRSPDRTLGRLFAPWSPAPPGR